MLMISKCFACVLAISSSASWAVAGTEFECTFDKLSTVKEVMKLSGHHFKVSRTEGGYELAQRYADGTWAALGKLTKMIGRDFVVYLHLPPEADLLDAVQILTVYQSGHSSLTTHHGDWGNQDQNRRAWMYQGKCHDPKDN